MERLTKLDAVLGMTKEAFFSLFLEKELSFNVKLCSFVTLRAYDFPTFVLLGE